MRLACVLSLALIAAPTGAQEMCSYDDAPAATLLLPYFEVDLEDPNGRTTLFSVASSTYENTLVQLVVWSDLGVPVLDYPIFLTGYDVQTINLRDLLVSGDLPQTGFGLVQAGDFSDPGEDFPGCAGVLPLPDRLPAAVLNDLRAALTGQAVPLTFQGMCVGFDHGDSVARGFITMDVARRCGVGTPRDAGYFGPDGIAGFDNVLWGDYYYVDAVGGLAQGDGLVRIHADRDFFSNGGGTFYGRYVGHDSSDAREPLPSSWGLRYSQGGLLASRTEVVSWRESMTEPEPFVCGDPPAPNLTRHRYTCAFDEEENPDCFEYCGIIDPPPPYCPGTRGFPLEANRIEVGGFDFPATWDFGWIYTNLNFYVGITIDRHQSWVSTLVSADGRFSVGMDAVPLDSGCSPSIGPAWYAYPF